MQGKYLGADARDADAVKQVSRAITAWDPLLSLKCTRGESLYGGILVSYGLSIGGPTTLKDVVRHVVETAERDLIVRTLERTRWNRAQAARVLGINYKTLYNKLKEYALLREEPQGGEESDEASPAESR